MRLAQPLLLLLSASSLLLGGCRSGSQLLYQPSPLALSTRLPEMEVQVENGPMDKTEGSLPEDPAQLFKRETTQNLVEKNDSSARFGYLKLQVLEAKASRHGKALHAIQMVGFLTPSLFGVPLEYFRTHVRAQLQVVDAKGEVLGTYEGTGDSNIKVAMYHGYSQSMGPRLADTEALKSALANIKPQLDTAATMLRTRLLSAGQLGDDAPGVVTGTLYNPAPAAPSPTSSESADEE
ncbi:hypothetical protein [Hymenobacter sp. BT730]|uniref:hypothetical protein n=1 Tax=Hymenobacter sp. BT730 TaxID=3063332 RepID=UPI0026DF6C9B|nr:hypothetical protein [Hymenobacter sp. BT730]